MDDTSAKILSLTQEVYVLGLVCCLLLVMMLCCIFPYIMTLRKNIHGVKMIECNPMQVMVSDESDTSAKRKNKFRTN